MNITEDGDGYRYSTEKERDLFNAQVISMNDRLKRLVQSEPNDQRLGAKVRLAFKNFKIQL